MKNIYLIPTEKPSRLYKDDNQVLNLHTHSVLKGVFTNGIGSNQHIYITSDVEIKEGDWFFRDGSIHKCFRVHRTDIEFLTSIDSVYCGSNTFWSKEFCQKIILTTDQDLIKDGVQEIDETFLDWFVKNPSCECVDVQKWASLAECGYSYHIIIPKEEPKQKWNPTQGEEVWMKVFSNWSKGTYIGYDVVKQTHIVREEEKGGGHLCSSIEVLPYYAMPNEPKQERMCKNCGLKESEHNVRHPFRPIQETLKEAAERFYPIPKGGSMWMPSRDDYNKANKQEGFIAGAKWQAERMYSEEDMKEAFRSNYTSFSATNTGDFDEDFDKWFKQFKKK